MAANFNSCPCILKPLFAAPKAPDKMRTTGARGIACFFTPRARPLLRAGQFSDFFGQMKYGDAQTLLRFGAEILLWRMSQTFRITLKVSGRMTSALANCTPFTRHL
ncbi:hypothetical protein HUU39_03075 [candidate division KSB1 bacterium]|nr:hypothetical protein [bacterium]NUM64246.1 hypothetical protein [candidate division KSB1 bacterium]